ncbi:MAG TPA: FtsX-like permease family protein, partial [Bacteroidales bacterium]|nr:FtsX-like permease family protein [Bacteroidales bacterium]
LHNGLGKNQDNIFTLTSLPEPISTNYRTFRQELMKRPVIKDITFHWLIPGKEPYASSNFTIDNKAPENKKIYMFPVSYNFNTFYGIRFLAGEDFTEVEPGQYLAKYIINETALHYLGYNKPSDVIGKPFQYFYFETDWIKPGYISGVVEDTYIASFEVNEKPLVMIYKDDFFMSSLSVKYADGEREAAVSAAKEVFHQFAPEKTPEIEHIGMLYKNVYAAYIKQQKLLGFILLVIILISCMGLFAVASFIITNRTKEIGIRKVNGSRTFSIVAMLNKDFLRWVFISFLFACPVAWYAMHKWLENFAYKTELSWWVFAAAGIIAMVIALLTVSWQSWKAASRNPVESLRYE